MKFSELNLFFLDLQTTGSRAGESDILEMAWGHAQDAEINSVLILPSTGFIPRRIQMLTGITEADMKHAVGLPAAFAKLDDFLTAMSLKNPAAHADQKPLAVIHFSQFEKPFLTNAYELLEQEIPFEILCTHQIAKRLLPNLPTRGIKGLAGYFGYNAGDLKRSSSHVDATRFIWQGLSKALAEQGVESLDELRLWLNDTPAKRREKYEYPLNKEKRLSLPDQPGVYRMLSRWGEVLYVGKATSLHSRVNSYFRGQKNRDPRKLEMLTQTWDLQVTVCGSPLESALLETDEIKRLNPRYNISLKTGARAMVFFNHDFTSMSYSQNENHCIGPFSNSLIFDSMANLSQSLQEGRFNPMLFFEPIDPTLLELGYQLFCDRHGFDPQRFQAMRSILAVGLNWLRADRKTLEDDKLVTDPESDFVSDLEDELEPTPPRNLEELLALTADEIADKFERHFRRAARAYGRARKLTRLLNADIDFQLHPTDAHHFLQVRGGQLQTADPLKSVEVKSPSALPWRGLGIDSYDRMSILASELDKIRTQDGTVLIKNTSKPCHS